jgi:cell division initiation protein
MRETLSAKDIEHAEFSTSLRGYDRDEVEAFLRTVADEHRRLSEELDSSRRTAEKPFHRLGADMGELLQHAKDSADQITKQAEEEAKQSRQEAKQQATAIKEKAQREAAEIKEAAEYEASMLVKDAERRVSELMGAENDARRRLHDIQVEIRTVMEGMQHAEASLGKQPADQGVSSAEHRAEQEASQEDPTEAELVPVAAGMGGVEVAEPVEEPKVEEQEPDDEGRQAEQPRPERSPAG